MGAFLFGSFPTGYLIGKLHGVDVRRLGSGSTGGTNVWRNAGMGAALLTIAGDALKAVAAIYLANLLVGTGWSQVLAGTLAILGHIWSPFLGWRGGRGVVAALAVTGTLCFPALAVVLVAGAIVILASRYVSLASLTVTALIPVVLYAFTRGSEGGAWWPVFGVAAAAIIWYAHRGNIRRLIEGTERRITWPPRALQPLLGRRRAG